MSDNDKMREAVLQILHRYTQEMEHYGYYESNPGVSVDDFDDIANEIVAWQAAQAEQSVPVVGEVVAHQFYADGKWHNFIDARHYQNTVAAGYEVRALVVQPTTSITATELDALRIAARTLKALLDRDLSYVDNVVYFTFESHTQAINHIIDARNAADAAIAGEKNHG